MGIDLYTEHLGSHRDAPNAIDLVIQHIEHFWSLGGVDTVCLGCDFDGAEPPVLLSSPNDLPRLAEQLLRRGYSEDTVEKLFWKNAKKFLMQHIFNS